MTTAHIGKPISRVDGRAKVTGEAKYAAEYTRPGPRLRLRRLQRHRPGEDRRDRRERGAGARRACSRSSRTRTPRASRGSTAATATRSRRPARRSARSTTPRSSTAPSRSPWSSPTRFELARYAATLVRVEYEREPHATDLEAKPGDGLRTPKERDGIKPPPKPRGHAEKALAAAAVRVDAEYRVPVEHHNPMELFATTVVRDEDGTLTVYDKTQGVQNVRDYLCNVFGSPAGRPARRLAVRRRGVRLGAAPAVPGVPGRPGGAGAEALGPGVADAPADVQPRAPPGDAGSAWRSGPSRRRHARRRSSTRRSPRPRGSRTTARRSSTGRACSTGATTSGSTTRSSRSTCPRRATCGRPGRSGACTRSRCAMDELAVKLGIDPVELRLKNYAEEDQNEDKPFSSKELRECYRQARRAVRLGAARPAAAVDARGRRR